MLRPLVPLLATMALLATARGGDLTLAEAMRHPALHGRMTGSGHGVVQVAVENRGDTVLHVTQPAGLICAGHTDAARVVTLRETRFTLPARTTTDVTIPAAALSSQNRGAMQPFVPTPETAPRLAPLLDYLAKNNDTPRLTTQLAVLCLLEDVSFAQWQEFLAPQRVPPAEQPTPAEIAAAVDALGLLRTLAPERTFALASDGELRRRALRNPWSRAKAAKLFGLRDPATDAAPAAAPPDLGTLLHTRANDNCPICRQRSQMQPREDGF